ncbi:protein Shroom [Glossina fuscipes]|uniref:Protein Shroom n=1 Tax=Glossina fuscipes TaxID=7396 RepID=A0A9C5YWX6_9MUSC|nr:protein Shroom [Glossina fuscipes]
MSFSSANSVQDDITDQCGLTKAGLEEYNIRANSFYDNPVMYHHQKQSSYAQSEGYHSYVSSSDSTSATPFLDRLRQESELLSRPTHHWSQNDLSSLASNSVTSSPTSLSCTRDEHNETHQQQKNGSESTSSTETLKWLGSMSDISEVSHATGFSAISESVSTSQLIVHSSRVLTPKRHQSESVLFPNDEPHNSQLTNNSLCTTSYHHQPCSPSLEHQHQQSLSDNTLITKHQHSPSYPPIHNSHTLFSQSSASSSSSSLHKSKSSSLATKLDEQTTTTRDLSSHKSSISVTISSSEAVVTISPYPPPLPPLKLTTTEKKNASPLSPSRSHMLSNSTSSLAKANTRTTISASLDSLADNKLATPACGAYRSNHRLFPISTYTEPVHSNTSQYVRHPKPQYSTELQKPPPKPSKLSSSNYPQPSWQSVAALISDFERSNDHEQSVQKYSYLDPNKTQRVPNPALKALQKNAVQSYFERQQQQQQQQQSPQPSHESLSPKSYHPSTRPCSLQNSSPSSELSIVSQAFLRNSLPSNYVPNVAVTTQRPTRGDQEAIKPPPPPPRSRTAAPTLLRRSSSASDYAEFRDQFTSASQEKLQSQSIKNITNAEKFSFNDCGMPPPPPPPRGMTSMPMRRTSSASEYAAIRDKVLLQQAAALAHQQLHPHQHSITTTSSHHQAFISHHHHHHHHHNNFIVPLSGLVDGWAPERPPKNPNLRVPSPDLPPPPALESDSTFSDEPLPPPPPEILQRQAPLNETLPELMPKSISPNRRNSFAGASLRKANFFGRSTSNENNSTVPPLIPRKPASIEILQVARPLTTTLTQLHCAKVHLQQQKLSNTPPEMQRSTIFSSSIRKRPHNLALSAIPSIQENAVMNTIGSLLPSGINNSSNVLEISPPPPPLMPRITSLTTAANGSTNTTPINHKIRCNSKASYLPRQSLEKQTSSDPDRGSYKMTLHSNEDLVATKIASHDILTQNGKLPNNLPDVLPLGVKLQPTLCGTSTAATSLNNSSMLRSGSNNNLASTSPTQQQTADTLPNVFAGYPQQRHTAPVLNTFSLSASYNRSQSLVDADSVNNNLTTNIAGTNNNHNHIPNRYIMTALAVDSKTALMNLEVTREGSAPPPIIASQHHKLLNSFTDDHLMHDERISQHSSSSSSLNSNQTSNESESKIFRAELVNTTLPNSPNISKKAVIRQESLRENIEKITQLQSQLMSAHISDNLLMSGFGVTSNYNNNIKSSLINNQIIDRQKTSEETEKKSLVDCTQVHAGENNKEYHINAKKRAAETRAITSDGTEMEMKKAIFSPKPDPVECKESKEEKNILSQLDSNTDSLKLIQRSELILRVNPSTVEVASQTEDDFNHSHNDSDMQRMTDNHNTSKETSPETPLHTTLQPRQIHSIELDCEKRSQELARMLPPNDNLILMLAPPGRKTVTDYVSQLYNSNVPMRPSKRDVGTSTLTRNNQLKLEQQGIASERLEKVELQLSEIEVNTATENCDKIKNKVDELIHQLNNKINILTKEKTALDEEATFNDELGNNLIEKLADNVRPTEASKGRAYITDVGHITGLLLSLSERLAKTENQLYAIGEASNEKQCLETKRDRLFEQLSEAKQLKEDIERRGASVTQLLERNLNAEELAAFEYFINMKAKLITDGRDITDKIKKTQELLTALNETLIQSDC